MQSLSRTTWQRKGRSHGARHGKTKEQKEYHIAWNAWKRCCKKVDSQGGHFTGIHNRVPQRSSLSWITTSQSDGQDKSAKSGTNLQKKTIHIVSLQSKREDTKDNGISPWISQSKMALMKLRSEFRAAVSLKNRLHHESGEQGEEPTSSRTIQNMASLFKHIVVGQVWIELEMSS